MSRIDTPPRRRPRVSLLSLLLLVALVAALVNQAMLYRDLATTQQQLLRLRDEVGALTISDPRLPHVIEIDTELPRSRRFRLAVPRGEAYVLCYRYGGVPATGVPTRKEHLAVLDTGEHVVSHDLIAEQSRDAYVAELRVGDHVRATRVGWVEAAWRHTSGAPRSSTAYPRGLPIVLLRYRASETVDPKKTVGPTDGFMLWLEPAP